MILIPRYTMTVGAQRQILDEYHDGLVTSVHRLTGVQAWVEVQRRDVTPLTLIQLPVHMDYQMCLRLLIC